MKKYLILSILLLAFVETTKLYAVGSTRDLKCCLGWREWVKLPDLHQNKIMAKIDTGAKTSSLHATNIVLFKKGNDEWVRFNVSTAYGSKKKEHVLEKKVIETKKIRSSNGSVTIRPVISTIIKFDRKLWPIELTLIDRSLMGHQMLLGRAAFSNRFLVDAGKSFILSDK